jgi:hypothetical protein
MIWCPFPDRFSLTNVCFDHQAGIRSTLKFGPNAYIYLTLNAFGNKNALAQNPARHGLRFVFTGTTGPDYNAILAMIWN